VSQRPTHYDVAVIGAGQAGLAIGHHLARQGRRFVIFDRADSIGAAWRARWDSLVLFTPRRYDALPELNFPGDPNGYPTRDEVISYLERYAETFELPIELGSEVRRLTRNRETFVLELDSRVVEAGQVVVATGPFEVPRIPDFARNLDPAVVQMHSTDYRNPGAIPEGTVLVVGGGNTGFQIAEELARTRQVHLSVGTRQTPLPQRLLGRDLFWWLVKSRLLGASVDSRLGRRLQYKDTLIGSSPRRAKRRGVVLRPRGAGASGKTITFADESTLEVEAVIWATGYVFDRSWIEIPVEDEEGRVRHLRGVTDTKGLYFLGLPWQHTRGSALLGWVKDDAAYIAEQIAAVA
jgi:putative flavoprotein involved in K+ transport